MVSVIIPVYNVEKYLDRCLKSVVGQTCGEIEILLINDGSTDHSLEKCLEWKERDKRISVYTKENEGVGATRNYGVDRACGEYILFVDPDDWISELCVEMLWKRAREQDADVVIFDYFWVISDNEEEFTVQSSRRYIEMPEYAVTLEEQPQMLSRVSGTVWNKFQRTEFVKKHQLRQPVHMYEDAVYVYQLLVGSERICQVRQELYYYWINREDSLTNIAPHVEACKLTLQEMHDTLSGTGKLKACYIYIEKFSSVLFQMCLRRIPKENKKLIHDEKSFYYEMYPSAKWVDELKFLLIGSLNLCRVFERMRLMNPEAKRYVPYYNPVYQLGEQESIDEYAIQENYDYVLFDLCGGLDVNLKRAVDWEMRLRQFTAILKKSFEVQRIFVLESRLALGEGGYRTEKMYEDAGVRQQINKDLEEMSVFLKSIIPEAHFLLAPEERLLFTMDKQEPQILNNYWYYDKADELRWVLQTMDELKHTEVIAESTFEGERVWIS